MNMECRSPRAASCASEPQYEPIARDIRFIKLDNVAPQDSVLAASWKDDIHKKSALYGAFQHVITRLCCSVFAVLKSKSVQGSSDRQ